MSPALVLDAAGLDGLVRDRPPERLRALLEEVWRRGREVLLPAVVCAEVCRGPDRTRAVEAALARRGSSSGRQSPVRIVDTDHDLARQVGAVLFAAGASTTDIVDAHVVAVGVAQGGAVVVTSDPADVARLAAVTPGVRLITFVP